MIPLNPKLQHQQFSVAKSFFGKLAEEVLKFPPPLVVPNVVGLESPRGHDHVQVYHRDMLRPQRTQKLRNRSHVVKFTAENPDLTEVRAWA